MLDELAATRIDRDHWFKMWVNARAELAAERERREHETKRADTNHESLTDHWLNECELRKALVKAQKAIAPIASLVALTADGFPDHDLCPIRLGQARALADAFAVIREVLTETGDRDD